MKSLCTGFANSWGLSRRAWLAQFAGGIGGIALADLLQTPHSAAAAGVLNAPHHRPRAKRVIYLFQSGGPSQLDLFDYKPVLKEMHGQQLPDEVRKGQRLTGMTGNQTSIPLASSPFEFQQVGSNGTWVSSLLPHTAQVVDRLCVVRSIHSEAINHGPGVTYFQTGSQFPGRPSMGAWLQYGLGSENENLPAFVVLITKNKGGQPLVARLWGSGFLPSEFQGVRFRSGSDPVLYLRNPTGIDARGRRMMLDRLIELHQLQLEETGDAALETRIKQYEMAFRMQSSIPDVMDFSTEPAHVLEMYGEAVHQPGSYAANCLLARRLAERNVRFIQLYHPGWDQHGKLADGIAVQCRETDQASAALIRDLAQSGLLEDTLVVWGGEFGRTNYCQGKLSAGSFGRDHHPHCFSMWLAGGGVQGGMTYGETDPFGYNVAADGVHVHDLHATILHVLGIDHERLTYKHQGRRYRLTDVHGSVVDAILT